MPGPEQVEFGLSLAATAAEKVAPNLLKGLPEIFGATEIVPGVGAATGLVETSRALGAIADNLPALSIESPQAARLGNILLRLHPEAPMRDVVDLALRTGEPGTINAVNDFFAAPIAARSLLTPGDVSGMKNLLMEGSPDSLLQVKSTLGAVRELGQYAVPDLTSEQILSGVKQSGVGGYRPWLGREITLRSTV
jgi:hypothetical protein